MTTEKSAVPFGQQQGNTTFGIMPEQAIAKLRDTPGADFIVIQRLRQSEAPYIFTSGDPTVTQDLLRHAYTEMNFDARSETRQTA